MLNPAIGKLIGNTDNRYGLVIEISKKAREIAENAEAQGEILIEKPVSLAIEALAEEKGL